MSEYPEFVFVAYDGDMTTEDYDISVSLEAGSLVGKPVKYIRHDINTRAVPDVSELETVGHLWECAEYYREERGWYGYIKLITEESPSRHVSPISKIRCHRELVTRDQAAEIISAKDAEIERLKLRHTDEMNDFILMGMARDEFKNRAEAAEAKLAQYEDQEPVGYIIKHPRFTDDFQTYELSEGDISNGYTQVPLYASPAPAADLKAENEKLKDALINAFNNIIHYSEDNENTRKVIGEVNLALDGDSNA